MSRVGRYVWDCWVRLNGRRLLVVLVLAVALLAGALLVRSRQVTRTDAKLCRVLRALVAGSGATVGKPGTPGYAYYQAHPKELAAARAQNQRFVAALDCEHLPTGG